MASFALRRATGGSALRAGDGLRQLSSEFTETPTPQGPGSVRDRGQALVSGHSRVCSRLALPCDHAGQPAPAYLPEGRRLSGPSGTTGEVPAEAWRGPMGVLPDAESCACAPGDHGATASQVHARSATVVYPELQSNPRQSPPSLSGAL